MYAGEEIECIITFKNEAPVPGQVEEEKDEELQTPNASGVPRDIRRQSHAQPAVQSRRSSIVQSKAPLARMPSMTSPRGAPVRRGHRLTLSLNVVSPPSRTGLGLQSAPLPKVPNSAVQPAKGHGRSLSIMSLGSDVPSEGRAPVPGPAIKRPPKGHNRSTSLQYVSKPMPQAGPHTGTLSPRQPSPLHESTTPPALPEGHNEQMPIRPSRRRPGTVSASNTPQLGRQNSLHKNMPSGNFNASFQFPPPQKSGIKSPSPKPEVPRPPRSPSNMHSGQQRSFSPQPAEGWSGSLSNLNPISRVMSESSTTGTPRSSSEFFSMSNHSDETLTSELPYQNQANGRLLHKSSHSRQTSNFRQPSPQKRSEPEILMMGYAQTMGSFTLDGSLVNAAPFEEVKRKGVQGGGGVVGVERSKRSSGMFGAFSWGNIGESLGGLLGGDEMSSMAQMKASAGSKSIPLLSTPQSLLFVDLRLAPGESRSYNYRFALPRGLPPSHRGRAIKVSYHLDLGIQRPEGQAVKHVEVPFRVLGSYNARGETLGHDLMSPYILLQDAAKTTSITPGPSTPSNFPKFQSKEASNTTKTPKKGLEEFLRYTERLIEQPKDAHGALISPTSPSSPTFSRTQSISDQQPNSVKEAVDFAILRANFVSPPGKLRQSEAQSANRFNIARSGQPVAVLTLLRPAYRIGEVVIGTIDFTAPFPESGLPNQAPTYSVVAEIESVERVDPSLALRSSSSINRVTRKVHASLRENTLFARRISFNLGIPTVATPTFETTGVSLVWRLRVEFTTQRQVQVSGVDAGQDDGELLEEISSDERGTTLIARERLMADTFEIQVPLKVYGAPGIEGMAGEVEALEV